MPQNPGALKRQKELARLEWQREKAAKKGLCIDCCIEKRRRGLTKCQACADRAAASVYRSRGQEP